MVSETKLSISPACRLIPKLGIAVLSGASIAFYHKATW